MLNFKQLKIWQKGFDIAANVFRLVTAFPQREQFGLALQLTRAAVSISSNIAEGSSRSSNKECRRFLEIALGSTFEVEMQLLIAKRLTFGDEALIEFLLQEIDEEQKMLISYMNKIAG